MDGIYQVTVVDFQSVKGETPAKNDVGELWADQGFGNDNYYYSWSSDDAEEYPELAKFLSSHNITDCLIHYWW